MPVRVGLSNGKDEAVSSKVIDLYTRVSRLSDARMLSTEGQEADCRARVREAGARVGQVHSDPGRSAWNPAVRRPGWDTLMQRIESGATGGVCVFDLARFTRRPIDGERLIAAAERGLIVLDSEHEFDLTSPDGKAQFRDHMKMAAYESDRGSRRTARGKRLRAQKGMPNGSHRAFGFEDDGLTVRPDEAEVIRDLAERFLRNETQDSLIRDLNERGVPTSYGKRWERGSLRQMLTRPRNAGWVVYRGEPVSRLPGEPILDQLAFDRVMALFASRKAGRPNSPRYVLSGIARCGHCGHGLSGRPRKNVKPYEDGEVKREYWCSKSTGGCGRIAIDQRALDDYLGDWAIRTLRDPKHADVLAREALELAQARAKLEHEADEIERTATEIAARLGRGEMPLARYDAITGPLDARLAAIREELSGLALPEPIPEPHAIPLRDRMHLEWLMREEEDPRGVVLQALNGRTVTIGPGRPGLFDPARVQITKVGR
jgi:DNA invertase Pin-like site-specific DNA recombinase